MHARNRAPEATDCSGSARGRAARADGGRRTGPCDVSGGDGGRRTAGLFLYPIIHMTGHGRVAFSDSEAAMLREYFERGGFLWADDNYGMDRYFREQINRVLPGSPLVELPFDHEIYHSFYDFPDGLPKIHEHDGGPPHGYGAFMNGRMVVFYSFNTDIGDGMEDEEVHHDPPEKHEAALRMGINIVVYALSH